MKIDIGTLIKYTHDGVDKPCYGIVIEISSYESTITYKIWWEDDGQWTEEEDMDIKLGNNWEILCE